MKRFTAPTTVRLTPRLYAALRDYADASEMAQSTVVRLAIQRFLEKSAGPRARNDAEDIERQIEHAHAHFPDHNRTH